MTHNIIIVGAGNVAWHLAHALHQKGCNIKCIYSRSDRSFGQFASALQAVCTTQRAQVQPEAGNVCLLCVSDAAIGEVARWLPGSGAVVAHTSGATSMELLQKHLHFGVFYPLQSFKSGQPADWQKIPVCITGNSAPVRQKLTQLARLLSPQVCETSDLQRLQLHLAAVFANNFSNHMLALAQQICSRHGLPFSLLQPLIGETFRRLETRSPRQSQTGPALRNDEATMNRHLGLLENDRDLQRLYRLVSESIGRLAQSPPPPDGE